MLWEEILAEVESIKKDSLIKNLYQTNFLPFNSFREALTNFIINLIKKNLTFALSQNFLTIIKNFFNQKETLAIIEKDLRAAYERDPACLKMIDVLLFYKGFHALCFYRLAHFLLKVDRPTALWLQYISSTEFSVDINPAAVIGKGFFIDHSHGIVIGETCRIKDNVSILQDVTLGGTGKEKGKDRHPKVGEGVLVGAGAKVLGNINIGDHSIIGASSVVLNDIPPNSIAVGIPAKVVKKNLENYPAKNLDHSIVK